MSVTISINASRIICGITAAAVLCGTGLLCVRLTPYWVAKYRGREAKLCGASLPLAPLRGANLRGADLARANLHGADLRDADLHSACLRGADLRGADLRGVELAYAILQGADLRGADLRGMKQTMVCFYTTRDLFRGAIYDERTRCNPGSDLSVYGARRVD